MTVRLPSGAAALVLVALLATACNGGDSTSTDADPATERTTGTPAAEGTGPESPAPGGNGQPGIEAPGLPVGGSGTTIGDTNGQRQCVSVNWLGSGDTDLKEGIQVTNIQVRLDHGEVTGSCENGPSCDGYTFTLNNRACWVAVSLKPGVDRLRVSGNVSCSLAWEECEKFTNGLQPQSIEVAGPPEPSNSELSGPIDEESGPIDQESGPEPPGVEEPPSDSE